MAAACACACHVMYSHIVVCVSSVCHVCPHRIHVGCVVTTHTQCTVETPGERSGRCRESPKKIDETHRLPRATVSRAAPRPTGRPRKPNKESNWRRSATITARRACSCLRMYKGIDRIDTIRRPRHEDNLPHHGFSFHTSFPYKTTNRMAWHLAGINCPFRTGSSRQELHVLDHGAGHQASPGKRQAAMAPTRSYGYSECAFIRASGGHLSRPVLKYE